MLPSRLLSQQSERLGSEVSAGMQILLSDHVGILGWVGQCFPAGRCQEETGEVVSPLVRRMNNANTRLSGEEASKCFSHVQHVAETHGVVITEPAQCALHCRGVRFLQTHSTHLKMAAAERYDARHHAPRKRVHIHAAPHRV